MVIIDYGSSMAKVLVISKGGIYSTFEVPLGFAIRPSLTVSQTINRIVERLPLDSSDACSEIYAVGEIASLDLKEILTAPPLDPKLGLDTLGRTILDIGLEFTYFDQIAFRGDIDVGLALSWLPFEASRDEIFNHFANSGIYRQRVPATDREIQLEQAIAREKLCALISSDTEDNLQPHYQEIILTGAVFSQSDKLGKALLVVLDTLPLQGSTQLILDSSQLLVALSALNYFDPEFLDEFTLSSFTKLVTLGTAVCVPGKLSVRLDLGLDSQQQLIVPADSLLRLALNRDQEGNLQINSADGYSLETSFVGGPIGLVFDTRKRPIGRPSINRYGREKVAAWQRSLSGT